MYIYKRLGLTLMLTGIIMTNTVTPAFASNPGPGGAGSQAGIVQEENSRLNLIDTTVNNPTGGKGPSVETQKEEPDTIQTEVSQEQTEQTNENVQQNTQTDSTQQETLSQELGAQMESDLEAEQEAAEAEAVKLNNPLTVPEREPFLQTTILLNDSLDWSAAHVNDQVITGGGQAFSSISTYLENIHGNVLYRTYDSQRGWTSWVMNGQQTHHNGQWVPVEAIQYRFAGPVGDKFDIYYTASLSDGTQTGWGKNGETVGAMSEGLYMTGFRLAFFAKGTEVNLDTANPLKSTHKDGIQEIDGAMRYIGGNGANYTGWGWLGNDRYYFINSVPVTGWQYVDGFKYYFGEDGKMWSDVEPLIGTGGPFMLKINKEMNCLTVYAKDGANGYIIPVKSFLTSVGDDTPLGTFRTPEKYRWRLMIHDLYTQYATRLSPGMPILIHSIIYDAPNPFSVWASTYNNLGIARSAGCIRLATEDSKWIYDHCKIGTTVEVYNSPIPGPFERPTIKYEIPFEQTWDPTDPNVTPEMIEAETQRLIAKFNPQK